MHITRALFAIVLAGAVVVLPARAPAQVNISLSLGKRLGPELSIFAYSQPQYGDWRTSYRKWSPVTVYEYQGHYYRHSVAGTRPIVVYSRNNEYFLPPPDQAWVGFDKRYNYKRQPDDRDRGRAKDHGPGNGRGRGNDQM